MIHSPDKRHTIKFLKHLIDNGFISKSGREYSEEEVRQEYTSRIDAVMSRRADSLVKSFDSERERLEKANHGEVLGYQIYTDASFDTEEIEREMFPLQKMKPLSLCSILRRETPVWILTA